MKWGTFFRGLLVAAVIAGLLAVFSIPGTETAAQGTAFSSLQDGKVVELQTTSGKWLRFRIFDVENRLLFYVGGAKGTESDWEDAVDQAETFAGQFSDTIVESSRLLTLEEIMPVSDKITVPGDVYDPSVGEDVYYVPNTNPYKSILIGSSNRDPYWTATESESDGDYAWYVNPSTGYVEETDKDDSLGITVRPMIVLRDGLQVASGDGSAEAPYRLEPTVSNQAPNPPSGFKVDGKSPDEWINLQRPAISFELSDPNEGDLLNAYQVVLSTTPTDPDAADKTEKTGSWASGTEVTFTPGSDLSEQTYHLYVRVKDQHGAWGEWGQTTFQVDLTPPGKPVISLPQGEWHKDRVVAAVTPGADHRSGVARTEYQIRPGAEEPDANGWNALPPDGKVTVPGSDVSDPAGTYTIYARTFDNAGNVSESAAGTVNIDAQPPPAPGFTIKTNGGTTLASGAWTNADTVIVTLADGNDGTGQSGYAKTEYSWDQTTWHTYDPMNPLRMTDPGTTTIWARGWDRAGNVSAPVQIVVNIDRIQPTAPTVTVSTYGWSNTAPTFTIAGGTDDGGSGIAKFQYSYDGTNWTDYPGDGNGVTISAEGETAIYARAVDHAGNVSVPSAPVYARYDKSAPNAPLITPSATSWAKRVTFTLTGQGDEPAGNNSGVAKLQYRFELNGKWNDYAPTDPAGIEVPGEGLITIYARAVDGAGNISPQASKTVMIDRQAPAPPVINTPSLTNKRAFAITHDRTDNPSPPNSGFDKIQYRVDYSNPNWADLDWTDLPGSQAGSGTVILPENFEGGVTIAARAVDQAGNASVSVESEILFDSTPPSTPTIVVAPSAWTNGDVTVTVTPGADAASGSGVQGVYTCMGDACDPDDLTGWTLHEGTDPFTVGPIADEGETTIWAVTVDKAGNPSIPASAVAKIDKTPPTPPTVKASTTGWTNQAVTFTLEGAKDDGSGIKELKYKIGENGTWTTYTEGNVVTVTTPGEHDINVQAIDHAGNVAEAVGATIKIDTSAPTQPAIQVTSADVHNGWHKGPVSFAISPGTDALSGVAKTEYQIGNGDWVEYDGGTETADLPAGVEQGTLTIRARTTDNAGNVAEASVDVQIDNKAPTAPTITSDVYDGAWTNASTVTINIAPGNDDAGSGVEKTEYEINGGTPVSIPGGNAHTIIVTPAFANANGEIVITSRSIDYLGNVSGDATYTVKMDTVSPTGLAVNVTSADVHNGWHKGPVSFAISPGTDALSGVAKTEYQIGNGDWVEYDGGTETADLPAGVEQGTLTIRARTTDNAGNVANTSVTVQIDNKPPTAPRIESTAGEGEWANQKVQLTITPGTDDGSGVKETEIQVNGETKLTFNGAKNTYEIDKDDADANGQVAVKAITKDNVGNSSEAVYTVKFDTVSPGAPTLAATLADGGNYPGNTWTKQNVTVHITDGSDQESGVAKSQYKFGAGGAWEDYPAAGLVIDREGQHEIYASTLDKAANRSQAAGPFIVKIDRTPPERPAIQAPSGWSSGDVRITLVAGADPLGEVDRLIYRTKTGEADWTDWQEYDANAGIVISADGVTLVEAKTVDKAGNESNASQRTVRIDSPGESDLKNGNDHNGDVNLDNPGDTYGPYEGSDSQVTGNVTISRDNIILQNVTIQGNVTVTGENAVLRNVTITGNLIIDGQVEQDFTAQNVTVQGTVIVNGGAPETVTFTDSALADMEVNKKDVHILLNGSTNITGTVTVNQASLFTVNTSGTINKIVVNANGVRIEGASGTIQEIAVASGISLPQISGNLTIIKKPSSPGNNGGSGGSGGGGGGGGSSNKDSSSATDGSTTIYVGMSGIVRFGKEVTVQIPAGAVTVQSQVTIRKVLDPSTLVGTEQKLLSPVYDIQKKPDGPFNKPATLTIAFDPQKQAKGEAPSIFYYNDVLKTWMELGGTVDGNTISVNVNNLMKFAVFAVKQTNTSTPLNPEPVFSDIAGHWAERQIREAAGLGIVKGYQDGTFRPNAYVNRLEFTVMLARLLNVPAAPDDSLTFKDAGSIPAWARGLVAGAVHAQLIFGDQEGNFNPKSYLTRTQMAAMIARAAKLDTKASGEVKLPYADVSSIPDWARSSVAAVTKAGLMAGNSDGRFAPNAQATRAQVVAVLLKLRNSGN